MSTTFPCKSAVVSRGWLDVIRIPGRAELRGGIKF
jgi:hypothetical protein